MTRLEALVDAIKTTPPSCASRRDALLELATAMTADARAACFVESLGARELLLKSLEGAIRRGDEALMDAVSAAPFPFLPTPTWPERCPHVAECETGDGTKEKRRGRRGDDGR